MCLTCISWSCLSPFCPLHLSGPADLRYPSPSTTPRLFFLIYVVVTVQIYLSRSTKLTGSTSIPAASAVTACSATSTPRASDISRAPVAKKSSAVKVSTPRKTPNFSLQLRKSGSLSSYSPLDTPSYRSPIKSPSQYFQICY